MSFSGDVKNSIIDSAPLGKCCRRALLLGIITARGQNEGKRISLTVDGDAVLKIAKRLVLECYGKEAEVTRRPRCRSGYFLNFTSSAAASYIERFLESEEINISEICKCKLCKTHFLQGIFLSSGNVSDPQKTFLLELSPLSERVDTLCDFMDRLDMRFRKCERQSRRYLYMKDGAMIADFFALIGDNDTTFTFLNSKIEKQFMSETNRIINCEASNISKTVVAASKTVGLIEELVKRNKLSALPEELKAIAMVRVEHRELSLSQLARVTVPPLSKSGLNHKLKRIEEIATEILKDK